MIPKFKVGDKVKLVTKHSKFYKNGSFYIDHDNLRFGEIYQVSRISNNGNLDWDSMFIIIKGNIYNHPVDCFELYEDWAPQEGDLVEVSNDGINWNSRIFLYSTKNKASSHMCISNEWEERYKSGQFISGFHIATWPYIRKPKQIKITIEVDGQNKTPKDFTAAQWVALRNK